MSGSKKVKWIIIGGLILVGGGMLLSLLVRQEIIPPALAASRNLAQFYERLADNKVRCTLCFHKCIIPPGMPGICRVRINHEGRFYTLVYGRPAGLQTDPIEAEPMYHMIPGHRNLGVFTASCNFRCKQCHNWHITQRSPDEIRTLKFTPEEVVAEAIRRRSRSISHTINEPTVFFEFMYDISVIARAEGLLTLFHSNGAIAPEPLRAILRHMDGVVIDLKAFCDKIYRDVFGGELAPVLETLKIIKEEGVWLEIVNLIIPTINDCMDEIRAMSEWIVEHLGPDVPLHFSRFHPAFRLTHLPPTPIVTLEEARRIAREAGINFVTIGNVPGHRYNSTFCPGCGKKLIHRVGFSVLANKIEDGRCKFCGKAIPGIWE
ncbi:AmmeMemoRadiSam system radical SAM enzyme [Candidatus Acetothermia bacterium]|nr:AmmeMemoRadiSam system radical SAM enzyme [Candidatus Acetothermia bacterium]MCI2427284.1 AmmeMemoRadiSam system radical SAM enzyme [Candidatus Acetothermia bacterium]MCI2427979.1 AmmeMemoRadiSam system radical SAM enzyme [Candidatus Acetothermia bacterium]